MNYYCNSSGTFLMPPAAAGKEKGRKRGHLALRPGDCVPQHPLLRSYLLLHINAAIDVESLTSDVVTINDQVADGTSYLLGGSSATEGYPLQDGLLRLFWNPCEHICLDKAGADRINRDVGASQFQGCYLGETDDACLGRSIVGLAKVPHLPHKGTDVDDFPASLLREMRLGCFDRVKATVQVRLDNLVPIIHGHVLHRTINVDTGVIDQHVYTPKPLNSLFDQSGCLRRMRDVRLNRYSLRCTMLQKLHNQLLCWSLALGVVHHQVCSTLP